VAKKRSAAEQPRRNGRGELAQWRNGWRRNGWRRNGGGESAAAKRANVIDPIHCYYISHKSGPCLYSHRSNMYFINRRNLKLLEAKPSWIHNFILKQYDI
jgi:hypothetical protein